MTNDPTPEKTQGATSEKSDGKAPTLIIGLGGTGVNTKEALGKLFLSDLDARKEQGKLPFLITLDEEDAPDQKG